MAPKDNLQSQAIGLIFGFPAVATVAVALRLYSRLLTRTFGPDDWVICFAGALYWAETVTSFYVIKYQYIGYHVWDIPKNPPTVLGAKFAYMTELLYNPILALVKTSILLFLLRLTGQKTAVRQAIWALLIFNGLAMIGTFFVTAFHCYPVAANWNPAAYPDAKCVNFADFVTGTAAVSIVTDALVLMLPTWIVYNLRIRRKQKILLIGILSFGLMNSPHPRTVISGIVRVVLLDRYDRHLPEDYTYSVLFCLSTIEVGLSFIAACAPSFKPLVMTIIPKMFGTKSQSGDKYNGTYSRNGPGYALEDRSKMSRRTHNGNNTTQIQGGDDVTVSSPSSQNDKNGV
ncbi:hypothetical protein N8T08_010672 [Aspergillus melleus]|uniref:Uncharacterized protein n=1 Tax=Aspergillus melleus TaxID=138277 RepID=A0ACC3BBU1_9EURO|nr:hypothetical protein N8T08_010672 [Aspergillus melleus]